MNHLATVPDPVEVGPREAYVTAVPVSACFVDHSYQRDVDLPRARRIAEEWNPRLVGVLDVSDRGEDYPTAGLSGWKPPPTGCWSATRTGVCSTSTPPPGRWTRW